MRTALQFGVGSIESTSGGFARLGALHRDLSAFSNTDITIDLSKLHWFDGHMAAPLRLVIRHAEARGNTVSYISPSSAVDTLLRKNGFLSGAGTIKDDYHTTMPVTEFSLEEAVKFSLYAKRHLDRKEMPKMSPALRSKFFEGIDELFANSALHSKSELGVEVGGQFYPTLRRLDFTLADGGRGIPGSVRASFRDRAFKDQEAIAWAMEDYNTTRQGDIPGGLGSKILRDFVRLNKGKLVIASNSGFWFQNGQDVRMHQLAFAFPGTAVLLEVNTSDKKSYDLITPPHPRDIW
jgi:hypothetical protein